MKDCEDDLEKCIKDFSRSLNNPIENSIVPCTAYILQIYKNPDQVNRFINQDVFKHALCSD